MKKQYFLLIAAFAMFSPFLGLTSSNASATPHTSILFIGNSFTFYNGGIDVMLNKFSSDIEAARLAPGGYRLEDHSNNPVTSQKIAEKKWDFVVLQEQSQLPILNFPMFSAAAKKLTNEIKMAGSTPVLFMTWERPDSVVSGVTTIKLVNAYQAAANQLKSRLAPVGAAFARAKKVRPSLQLYENDGHPTMAGTYLAACVFFTFITQKRALVLDSSDMSISRDTQLFLIKIAEEEVL